MHKSSELESSVNPANLHRHKSLAPINHIPIHVSFPEHVSFTLSNGLKVMAFEQHDSPMVNVRLYLKAGAVVEGDKKKSSAFAFALLQQGTLSRSASEIADEIEFLGADLSSSGNIDFGSVGLSILSKHLEKGLNLFADIILHPSFLESELEFIRQQSISRLQYAKADATYLSGNAFNRELYGAHPYGSPSYGTMESLLALTKNDILHFYQNFFSPERAFIVVSGDINTDILFQMLEGLFSQWRHHSLSIDNEASLQVNNQHKNKRLIIVQKEGAVQSVVNLGHISISRNSDYYVPLYVANMILGGFFGSRLNMNLREKQGYTYGIRSGFDTLKYGGDFNISTQVRNEVTGEALNQILIELNQFLEKGVTEKELHSAKKYISGNFVIQNESPSAIANRIATVALYDLPSNYFNTYIDQINSVSKEEVRQAALSFIHPESFLYAIAGDKSMLLHQIERFGTVTIQDSEGNQVNQI